MKRYWKVKKPLIVIIALTLTGSIIFTSSAHTTKQANVVLWGDTVGWSIDEDNHSNGREVLYRVNLNDPYLYSSTSEYRQLARQAANVWNNATSYVYISEESASTANTFGELRTISNENLTYAARVDNYYSDKNGHFTYYGIIINRVKFDKYTAAQKKQILAHEFGHAIGLNHVSGTENLGKLMYYDMFGMGSTPSNSDKIGARVINGNHSTHTWAGNQLYYDTTSSGKKRHRGYCTICSGWNASIAAANCTYNTGGTKCTVCNTSK